MALLDRWSALDFKDKIRRTRPNQANQIAESWVGHHKRRLTAYEILYAYTNNTSRIFREAFSVLDTKDNFDPVFRQFGSLARHDTREYGDANVIVQQVLAALIGETQIPVVPGAANAREAGETDQANKDALACEDYLRQWFEDEMMQLKLISVEKDAIISGDGVYAFGWSPQKHRNVLRVWPSGMYFPVLDPESDADFPKRVHIAYEYESDEDDRDIAEPRHFIRRITWELNDDGECTLLDAVWLSQETGSTYLSGTLIKSSSATVDRFDIRRAVKFFKGDINGPLNLGIRHIPVVHMPNDAAGDEHFGTSTLMMIAQILDDLQNVDTDLQKAAATTGTPPIALIGNRVAKSSNLSVGPGSIWELSENGDLKVLDTSKSLDALIKLSEYLQKRLSANVRLPEALLGKVDPSKAPSGLAIALTFGPLIAMITQMRLVRRWKYGLLFKFVLEDAIAAKAAGDNHKSLQGLPANLDNLKELPKLEFGNFLPTDLSDTVNNVVALINIHAISVETGLKMLQEAGLPIVSIKDEALRLQHADFAGAKLIFDSSGGDVAAVAKFLGISLTKPTPPAPVIMHAPGTPPVPGAKPPVAPTVPPKPGV